ncbi:MAG: histidine phosphatase family protein [Phaeodactylibacter sp.]|nr:histidine phosphatase family protein [Phaeodactylibacter sp.]MCB9049533.1 histidine phosphatase family protein [Lewinellaceae bacterium]
MLHFTRLSILLLFLGGLATCNPPQLGRVQPSSVQSITSEYIQFKNGKTVGLPFAGQENVTRVFLVRHAEKGYGSDPTLTSKGVGRAHLLANIFKDLPLDAVYATKYKRTLETALPVAQEKGLEVAPYAPDRLTSFSFQLRRKHQGQSVLVVGHSDTTPNLVNRIVTRGVLERIDERDYSNFYVVAINEEGEKEVLQLKYGEVWAE